jgi:uncharacterized membrane protein YkoI
MDKKLFLAGIVVTSLLGIAPAVAHEKLLSKQEIPQAVLAAFKKDHPAVNKVKYEEEFFDGKIAYEIAFRDDKGQERSEVYNAEGSLVETEKTIKINELPEAVAQAVKNSYPQATLQRAFQVSNPSGTVTGYEIEIREGKRERELEFDTNGKVMSRC